MKIILRLGGQHTMRSCAKGHSIRKAENLGSSRMEFPVTSSYLAAAPAQMCHQREGLASELPCFPVGGTCCCWDPVPVSVCWFLLPVSFEFSFISLKTNPSASMWFLFPLPGCRLPQPTRSPCLDLGFLTLLPVTQHLGCDT